MAFRVVAKSGWRKVPLPKEFFEKEGAEGLTCIEELTDYELTEDGHLQVNTSKVVAYVLENLVISPISVARSTSIIYSQQSFMIITGRRMSGCYTCYKIKMDCIDL